MTERHTRAQSLLLLARLLDCRDNVSPFTLVLDSLEQSARPLLAECIRRATSHKTNIVFVAADTHRPLDGVSQERHLTGTEDSSRLRQRIVAALPPPASSTRSLIVFDNLNLLASEPGLDLSSYLSSLVSPLTSLVAVYHQDQPLASSGSASLYAPSPLTLLRYLATAVMSLHSFSHVLAEKDARKRSVAAPLHGLRENEEGVLQGLGSQDRRGIVVELEHRRRSGRSVHALFFLEHAALQMRRTSASKLPAAAHVMLLHDHPLFQDERPEADPNRDDGVGQVSFNLGLTEKQRRDRDGVVLPYFDAQSETGAPAMGGRILYDMGVEDDFDEEEDEI